MRLRGAGLIPAAAAIAGDPGLAAPPMLPALPMLPMMPVLPPLVLPVVTVSDREAPVKAAGAEEPSGANCVTDPAAPPGLSGVAGAAPASGGDTPGNRLC